MGYRLEVTNCDFKISRETDVNEKEILYRSRSQTVTLKWGMNIKYPLFAVTEHGAIIAATVLNSPQAVQNA